MNRVAPALSLVSAHAVIAALVAVLGIGLAGPARADVPGGLIAAAKSAAAAEHYCPARDLYVEAFRREAQPKFLYNAAELAFAADDRGSAATLYSQLLRDFPAFEDIAEVRARFVELGTALASGPGTPCPAPSATCGDWLVGGVETCDDGNSQDGDGCDRNCRVTGCGNGVVTGVEECDDGNLEPGDGCSATCQLPRCGNGIVEAGEQCDDANANDGDGCNTCRIVAVARPVLPVVVPPAPVAAPPAPVVAPPAPVVAPPAPVVAPPAPVVAPPAPVAAPAAAVPPASVTSPSAAPAAPARGTGSVAASTTTCGDGRVAGNETCDDGNRLDGDGCSATCAHEGPSIGTTVVLGVLSVAAIGAGSYGIWVGAGPWLDYQASRERLLALQDDALAGDADAIAEGRDEHELQEAAWQTWESQGMPIVLGSALGAGIGLAIGVGAIAYAASE